MKARTIQSLFLLATVALSSCSDSFFDCQRGNKELIEESREVEPFIAISISNSFVVEYTQGDEYTVVVEAEENIIDDIFTGTKNNTLVIKKSSSSCISERKTITVTVTSPDLEAINLSGSGFVKVDSLTTDYLNLRLSGSGDMKIKTTTQELDAELTGSGRILLEGQGDRSDLEVTGSGDIDAFDFEQRSCYASITGSGDIRVDVSEFLDANITGSGDIIYQGNPVVVTDITGSGDVKKF